MYPDELKTLLSRLKRSEFTDFLKEWGRLGDTADVFTIESTGPKHLLVSTTLKDCKRAGVDEADLDEFDLLFLHHHSKSKQWTAFEIDLGEDNTQIPSVPPAVLKKKLWKELRKYFPVRVSVLCRDEAFWLRILIAGEGARGKDAVLYCVYYPHTNYFFATKVKATLQDYVSQAFCSLLSGAEATPLNLQGRCVRSLAQLTVGKASQGAFNKFRLDQVDPNPLVTHKRKRQENDDEDFDVFVVNENLQDKRRRVSLLDEAFGSYPQPTLEHVTYEMQTNFAGVNFAPAMAHHKGPFRCLVRFEGRSVLDGMRQLGRAGLADLPMKSHVGRIHSYAQNRFLLRAKTRAGGDKNK